MDGSVSGYNWSQDLPKRVTYITLLSSQNGSYDCELKQPAPTRLSPLTYYTNTADLADENDFVFYWNTTSDQRLVGEIHARTLGWVGFGLSPNGGMDGSDVIVAWIDGYNGIANFTDRHIVGREVLIDANQTWALKGSYRREGFTVIQFERPLVSCDPDDISIEVGTPFFIYAMGDDHPAFGQDIGYHLMKRGAKALNIISSSSEVNLDADSPDLEEVSFPVGNVILPRVDTFYYIKLFAVPPSLFEQKRHIVRWEMTLPPKINKANIHHSVVHECDPLTSEDVASFQPTDGFQEGTIKNKCHSITITWAYGGNTINYYPKDTGYPIGGDTDYKHFLLEIHYDNPEMKIGYIEDIQLKYFLSKDLKKNELGGLTLGAVQSLSGLIIPPKQADFEIQSTCPSTCLSRMYDQDLTIISAMSHTHLTGYEIWTKIVRDNKDAGFLFRNANYDFNYQNNYPLNVTVRRTDDLVTKCGFRTLDRELYTKGGERTTDEMCYQFLIYYPRQPKAGNCYSMPSLESSSELLNKIKKQNLAEIGSFNPSTSSTWYQVRQLIAQLNTNVTLASSPELAQLFVDFYKQSTLTARCSRRDSGFINPTNIQQFQLSDQYISPLCDESNNATATAGEPIVQTQTGFFQNIINRVWAFFQRFLGIFGISF